MVNFDSLRIFEDDDAGYVAWVASHPSGFVVNANRLPNASYVVLHRATCRTISGDPTKGRSWTSAYLKACSEDRHVIDRWVRTKTGTVPSTCGTCLP